MDVKLEDTIRGTFGTAANATGAATDADSTPTCVVLEQGTALGYAPTCTNKGTGIYEVAINCTAANGFEVGKEYTAYVVVIVGGITARGPVPGVSAFTIRARSRDDLAYPTTSGRSIDVTTTGEVGLDWANIGAPTTSQTLSGTTVGTATAVTGVSAGGITAASIANAAIDYATFAQDALDLFRVIRRNTCQAGSTSTSAKLDTGASSTDGFYAGCFIHIYGGTGAGQTNFVSTYTGSTRFCAVARTWVVTPDVTSTFIIFGSPAFLEAGAILGSTFFTDAITANAIDSTAITEIQNGLATAAALATVQADTDNIQTRLPTALVSGRMDSSVGAMAAGVLTATAIASDAITDAKVASDVTIASVTGAVGSVTGNVGGNVTGSVGSVATGGITAASIADAALDRATFAQDALDLFRERRRNTATAGAASTITLDASASTVDDFYKNGLLVIVGGTGIGQFRSVASYVGSTKVATVDRAWSTVPDATSVFELFAGPPGSSGTVDANVVSMATDAISAASVSAAAVTKIAAGVNGAIVIGSHTVDDLRRLFLAIDAGPATDFSTGTQTYRCPVTSTVRLTVTTDATGRLTSTLGDLT